MRDFERALERALELPDISYPDGDIRSLREQTRVMIRLPQIPGASIERFYGSNRAEEAAAYAEALGIAYAKDRRRAIIMRAKARAEARIAQLYAEGRL